MHTFSREWVMRDKNRGQKVGREHMRNENERTDLDGNGRTIHLMLTASARYDMDTSGDMPICYREMAMQDENRRQSVGTGSAA